jgi:hypothetical protein
MDLLFVAPSGIAENAKEFLAPARSVPGVAKRVDPLMKGDAHGVVGMDVLGESEANGVGGILGLPKSLSQMISVPP